MNVLDDRPLEAAAQAELYFWKDPMLLGSFDSHRQKGIGHVASSLQKSAGEWNRIRQGKDCRNK